MAADAGSDAGPQQSLAQQRLQLRIESTDVDVRLTNAAVNSDNHVAAGRQLEALRMIEQMAGDVQLAIAPVGLETFKAEEAVLGAGDQARQLRSSDFYAAPVGGENDDRRGRPVQQRDLVIAAQDFAIGQMRKGCVTFVHSLTIMPLWSR